MYAKCWMWKRDSYLVDACLVFFLLMFVLDSMRKINGYSHLCDDWIPLVELSFEESDASIGHGILLMKRGHK